MCPTISYAIERVRELEQFTVFVVAQREWFLDEDVFAGSQRGAGADVVERGWRGQDDRLDVCGKQFVEPGGSPDAGGKTGLLLERSWVRIAQPLECPNGMERPNEILSPLAASDHRNTWGSAARHVKGRRPLWAHPTASVGSPRDTLGTEVNAIEQAHDIRLRCFAASAGQARETIRMRKVDRTRAAVTAHRR
jgi:hypothetical protein